MSLWLPKPVGHSPKSSTFRISPDGTLLHIPSLDYDSFTHELCTDSFLSYFNTGSDDLEHTAMCHQVCHLLHITLQTFEHSSLVIEIKIREEWHDPLCGQFFSLQDLQFEIQFQYTIVWCFLYIICRQSNSAIFNTHIISAL